MNLPIPLPRSGYFSMEEHPQARFIVETLIHAGYTAYYAGGWVRDLLLKHPSDDIDIATNATPETIQQLFPHTVPVGISFGIVVVLIEGRPYEVATFRKDIDYQNGRSPSRIEFTTAQEDAQRRDFTINGMFYDPITETILDYVDGQADLQAKIIRAIGNAHDRIREDRLRMIRAIRLSCRFHFHIEEWTAKAIRDHATELFPAVAIERVWQELMKGHQFGNLQPMLVQLHEFGLLQEIFPPLKNTPVEEVKNRLHPTYNYPPQTPVIAFLLPLFPQSSPQELTELCNKLKLPTIDHQFVSFLCLKTQPQDLFEWAYFYAHPFASLVVQIRASHLEPLHRADFLQEHEQRKKYLHQSIQRIVKRDPVVKSSDLTQIGIQPGKSMGQLLKQAERIAINEQLNDPILILKRLNLNIP